MEGEGQETRITRIYKILTEAIGEENWRSLYLASSFVYRNDGGVNMLFS